MNQLAYVTLVGNLHMHQPLALFIAQLHVGALAVS